MTSFVRTTTRWAALVLLVATLAACGTSGSKSAATTDAKTTTTDAKTTTTPDTSSTTGSTGAIGSTSLPSTTITTPSTVVATGGGAFCQKVADSYNSGLTQSTSAASTPAGLRKLLEASKKKSDAALASAPGEIKPDLGVLFGASNKLIAALDKVGYDVTKLPPSASASFSSPAVQAASTRVAAFVKKRCGINLGSSSSGSGSSPQTTIP